MRPVTLTKGEATGNSLATSSGGPATVIVVVWLQKSIYAITTRLLECTGPPNKALKPTALFVTMLARRKNRAKPVGPRSPTGQDGGLALALGGPGGANNINS